MCAKQPITCVIFGLLFLSAGCRNAENNLYRIPLKEALSGNVHRFSAGEVIDSVRYIPLETTDSCFIGDLYKILCWKDFYYIRDLQGNLYLFTTQGHFLRKIGKQGRGPEEYTALCDFAVDPANGDIYLLTLGKVMVFSLYGELNNTFPVSTDWEVCTFAPSGFLAFITPVSSSQAPFYLLNLCDKQGETVLQIPGQPVNCGFVYYNWIQEQGGKAFYKEEFSDTLYYLDAKNTPHPYACMDFGNFRFVPALFDFAKAEKWTKYYRLDGVFNFTRTLVMNVQQGLVDKNIQSYLFDKSSGTIGTLGKRSRQKGFIIDGIECFPLAACENQLICAAYASQLPENPAIKSPQLKAIANSMSPDSNPLLVVLFMK